MDPEFCIEFFFMAGFVAALTLWLIVSEAAVLAFSALMRRSKRGRKAFGRRKHKVFGR